VCVCVCVCVRVCICTDALALAQNYTFSIKLLIGLEAAQADMLQFPLISKFTGPQVTTAEI